MDSASIFMSPKRVNGFSIDPSNYTPSPPLGDATIYPWNWGSGMTSSDVTCSSPETPNRTPRLENNDAYLKRGRPRADSISNLIEEGSRTKSPLQCNVCTRIFPRDKSLQAHMRTHTGERPYLCDYPGCGKSFCQSGQLKTHQRLHTGEKPFICSHPGCVKRFTHANRHCSEHPYSTLERDRQSDACSEPDPLILASSSPQIQHWLHLYYAQRTPLKPKSSSQTTATKRSLHLDIENEYAIETKRRAGLSSPVTPLGTSNSPIKRAPPNTPEKMAPHIKKHRLIEQFEKSSENQDTLLGALALMELAHGPM